MTLKRLLVLIMAMLIVFSLAACSSPKTLEEYVDENPSIETDIEAEAGEEIDVDFEGNKLIYTYEYDQTFTEDQIATMEGSFESAVDSMASTFEGLAAELEEETGIDGISIVLIYEDAADTVIYTAEFE